MKNFKHIFLYTAAIAILASSCKKSFIDSQPLDNTLSTEQEAAAVKQDPSLLKARIAGLYTTMYADGIGGTGGADDFGQKGFDIYSDMLSGDMVLAAVNYGWYEGISRFTATLDNASNEDYMGFRYYYKVIFAANTVIDVLGGNNAVLTDPDLKHYMGEAKAMRAYAYLYVSNLYAVKGYGTGAEKILPIYTSTKDLNEPLSTSAAVYGQMVKDLTDAITLLADFTRDNKGQIDADVAKGLLAYVYAAIGTNDDLANVITLTNDVLAKYPLTTADEAVAVVNSHDKATNPASGFNNLATPSWIWGADLTLASNLDLNSWWGQVDIYTYSYAWVGDSKVMDEGLYDAIPATDIRKNQFVNDPDYGLVPTGKFFNENRVIGGQRSVTDDYIYMRADEMLLLNAEAQARLGQDAAAKTELDKLLAIRYPTSGDYANIDAMTGQDLLNEIYFQTRVELWGEGKSYLSMKRNKYSITLGSNHLTNAGSTYDYDAPGLTFVLPSAEILYNPNLYK